MASKTGREVEKKQNQTFKQQSTVLTPPAAHLKANDSAVANLTTGIERSGEYHQMTTRGLYSGRAFTCVPTPESKPDVCLIAIHLGSVTETPRPSDQMQLATYCRW